MGKNYIVDFNPKHSPVLPSVNYGQKFEAWKTQESEKLKKLSPAQQIAFALGMLEYLKTSWHFHEDQSWGEKFEGGIATLKKPLPVDVVCSKPSHSPEDSILETLRKTVVTAVSNPQSANSADSQGEFSNMMADRLKKVNRIIESAYLDSRNREETAAKVKAEILLSPEEEKKYGAKREYYIKKDRELRYYQDKILTVEAEYDLYFSTEKSSVLDSGLEAVKPLSPKLFSYMQEKPGYNSIIQNIDNRSLSFSEVEKLAKQDPTIKKTKEGLKKAKSRLDKNSKSLLGQVKTIRKQIDDSLPLVIKNYRDELAGMNYAPKPEKVLGSLNCMVRLFKPLASTYGRVGWSVMKEIEKRQKLGDPTCPTGFFERLSEKDQRLVGLLLAIYAAKSVVGSALDARLMSEQEVACLQKKIEEIGVAKDRWSVSITSSSSSSCSSFFSRVVRFFCPSRQQKELSLKNKLDIELGKAALFTYNLNDINKAAAALKEKIEVCHYKELQNIEDSILQEKGKKEASQPSVSSSLPEDEFLNALLRSAATP